MKKRMLMVLFAALLAAWLLPVTAYGASQAEVTFRVMNGAWAGGERVWTEWFDLGSVLSEEDLPKHMSPDPGYGGGEWKPEPLGWKVSEEATFYFYYQQLLEVQFDANGGAFDSGESRVSASALSGKACLEWPEEPFRDGYTFAGWCENSGGTGRMLTEDSAVTENMTVYAVWRENRRLTLMRNDGSGDAEEIELPGGVVWLPDPPEREGWEFDHWNTQADGSGEVLKENAKLNLNITVYAQWRRIFYLLFDGNSEVPGVEKRYTAENVGILSHEFTAPGLTRKGHTLVNWNTRADGSGTAVSPGGSYTVDEDSSPATLYAQWERNAYQVRFEGTEAVLDCLWNDTVPEADFPEPVPAEGNFRFGGWRTAPEGKGVPFTADTPVTDHITVYPHWIRQVEVIFQIRNGCWKETGSDAYSVTLDLGAALEGHLPTAEAGDDFKDSGKWDKTPSKAAEGAVFTYTCDARNRLQITFDTGDGPLEVLEGRCTALPAPVKAGFHFAGWYTGKTGGEQCDETTEFLKNTSLYARWIPVFTLTYIANGGEDAPDPQELEDNGETHAFTVSHRIPVREGCSFQGWSETADAETAQFHGGDLCSAGRDVTLYAVWKKDVVLNSVTFLDRGAETAKLNLVSGTAPGGAMPETPVWQGHWFLGWNTQENGAGEFLTKDTEIAENVTVYAVWKEILQVTVTFFDRGREVDWFSLDAGDSMGADMPMEPARKGYLFLGWQSGDGALLDSGTSVHADLAVYAAWEKITRGTIAFLDGEEEICRVTLDLGAKIGDNMPEDPACEHARFLGWNTREDGTGARLYRSTVLREDMTAWAQWQEIEYVSLTFHDRFADSRSLTLEQNTKAGDRFPAAPARPGYTFSGWYTEPGGEGVKVTKTTKIQEDTEVYACWKQKNTANAKTGDGFDPALWITLLALSGTALAVIAKRKKN